MVADLDAAVTFAVDVLGLQRCAPAATDEPDVACFRVGAQWLAFERQSVERLPTALIDNIATLHWRCSDLQRQRTLLLQSGLDLQNDTDPGGTAPVRVAAAETGACALEWVDGPESQRGERPCAPGITGLVLPARAPERVAAHWAQIFQVSVERHAAGTPCLVLDGIGLRFVFVDAGAGGVGCITLALSDPAAVRERATACGMAVDGDALMLAGLTIDLASA